MKCAECVDLARGILERGGIISARREAEILFEQFFGVRRESIYCDPVMTIPREHARLYLAAARLRSMRYPLQYITGCAFFYGIELEVREGVFIPRPETETLVELALETLSTSGFREPRVIDVGTGCGNIAVAIAVNEERARVTATDLSVRALRVAEKNARKHGVAGRVELLRSDLFDALEGTGRRFDIVVSNPPYVTAGELDGLDAEVRFFEPRLAIDGGEDGLDLVRRLAASSRSYLEDGGFLLLEIDPRQAGLVTEAIFADWEDVSVRKDLSGKERVVVARKG